MKSTKCNSNLDKYIRSVLFFRIVIFVYAIQLICIDVHMQGRRQGVWLGVTKCLDAAPALKSRSAEGGGGGRET